MLLNLIQLSNHAAAAKLTYRIIIFVAPPKVLASLLSLSKAQAFGLFNDSSPETDEQFRSS